MGDGESVEWGRQSWMPCGPPTPPGFSVPLCSLCAFPSFLVLSFPRGSMLHPKAQIVPQSLGRSSPGISIFKAPQITLICSLS